MNKHREEKEEQLHSPEPEPEPGPEEPEQHTTCDHVDECVLRMEVNTLTPRHSGDVSVIQLSELNVSPAATRRSAHWTLQSPVLMVTAATPDRKSDDMVQLPVKTRELQQRDQQHTQ